MINITKAILKNSIEEFFIYRSTSIITFILALVFLIIELITGTIYFSNERMVNGWTENDYFILITFTNSASYIYNIFFILGHESLSENILDGNLDYYFTRPVSSYWLIAGGSIDIPSIFNFIISFFLLITFLHKDKVTVYQLAIIIFLLISAAFMIFLLNQICLTLLFWFNGLTELGGIVEDFISYASRPKSIFPKLIQKLFTFVIPILLMTNISNEYLKYGITSYTIYYFVFLIMLFLVSKALWKKGIKRYASAN